MGEILILGLYKGRGFLQRKIPPLDHAVLPHARGGSIHGAKEDLLTSHIGGRALFAAFQGLTGGKVYRGDLPGGNMSLPHSRPSPKTKNP